MGGGLINIISYGFNDLYLTGSPEMTLFKIVYRRHTSFSKESISVPIGMMDLNEEITIDIPKSADLFGQMYLQLETPAIHLLKTETADGLTEEEKQILNTPLPISMTQDEIDIVDSYSTILDFISVNSAGYRSAIANQYVKNQSVLNYINTVIASMDYSNQQDTSYKTALDNAKLFEQELGTANLFMFDNTASDINYILGRIKDTVEEEISDSGVTSYTISQIVEIAINAMNVSIQIKKYYYEKKKKKYNLELDVNSSYAKFAWVDNIGHNIIDRVDINIGGERIDRHYGDWMNIWHELTSNVDQDKLYNEMIGNVDTLTTYDRNEKPVCKLIIPLNFWFCKKSGLSFPLASLQYSKVSITIKLKSFEQCAYVEKLPVTDSDGDELNLDAYTLSDIWDNNGLKIQADLLIEYVYLENLERKRFAQSAHEYLIDIVEQMEVTDISDANQSIQLDFSGPSKEIIWHAKRNIYNSFESTYIKYPSRYSLDVREEDTEILLQNREIINPFSYVQLMLNGKERFFSSSFYDPYFYNYLQSLEHHKRTPSVGVNMYSFGLFPDEHQPSASCNFSVISQPTMNITLNKNMFTCLTSDIDPSVTLGSDDDIELTTEATITIYSVRTNVLRIIGGMAAFAYSYSVQK